MFAFVPALYAGLSIIGAAFAARDFAAGNTNSAIGAALFSAVFIWCVVVSVRRSRGE